LSNDQLEPVVEPAPEPSATAEPPTQPPAESLTAPDAAASRFLPGLLVGFVGATVVAVVISLVFTVPAIQQLWQTGQAAAAREGAARSATRLPVNSAIIVDAKGQLDDQRLG
jgi:hypothetical protein